MSKGKQNIIYEVKKFTLWVEGEGNILVLIVGKLKMLRIHVGTKKILDGDSWKFKEPWKLGLEGFLRFLRIWKSSVIARV